MNILRIVPMFLFIIISCTGPIDEIPYDNPFDDDNSGSHIDQFIVFSSDRDGDSEIFKAYLDGSNLIQLTSNTFDDHNPVISPDGSKIAYISNETGTYKIYTINRDGTNKTEIPNSDCEPAFYKNFRGLSWKPDGTQFVFIGTGATSIKTIDIDGSNLTTVISGAISPGYDHYNSVDWGLADNNILFNVQVYSWGYNQDIFLYVLNISNYFHITDDWGNSQPNMSMAGSRSGTSIVFNRQVGTNPPMNVYKMNSDGSNVVQLTNYTGSTTVSAPSFCSSETKIVYASDVTEDWEIYIMDSDGSDKANITNDTSRDALPDCYDGQSLVTHKFLHYITDFSSDPYWETNGTGNQWNSTDNVFELSLPNNTDPYALLPINWTGNSFELKYDLIVDSNEWSSGVTFGLFNSSRNIYSANDIYMLFGSADPGKAIQINTFDSENNQVTSSGNFPNGFTTSQWYSCDFKYNSTTKVVSYVVKNRDTGETVHSDQITMTGHFSTGTYYLGVSRVGVNYGGYTTTARIDNVKLYKYSDGTFY